MKQFNLKEYNEYIEKNDKAPKLVTRDGNSARIICMDKIDNYPIVALVNNGDFEYCVSYTTNGKASNLIEPRDDLFFDLPDPVKRVPLTYKDLLERVKAGKTMWLGERITTFNIIDFDIENIYYVHGEIKEILSASYDWLVVGGMTFADGDPCWKEE